jgi:pimeloyl-ACP methyl ester carboxylesterase
MSSSTSADLWVYDRGRGPAILFVHGFPLDHSMWAGQGSAFDREYRVLTPDLRGFGFSGPAEGTVSMAEFADDLAALLDRLQLSEPIVLCGLSMGGYIALQFWKRHRNRLRALVLCDTRAAADSPEAAENRHKMAEQVMTDGSHVAADAMLPKLFPPQVLAEKPNFFEATKQVILGTSPTAIAAAQRGMAVRPEMRAELGEIDVPTLVVCGELDAISPPTEMREIAAAIPGSRMEIIAGAGHLSPLEKPDAFNAVLSHWLSGLQ